MLNFLTTFLPGKNYEKARDIAEKGSERQRLSLAKDSNTHKEILYYLAEHDPSEKVRRAVARNDAAPVQVAPLQAGDQDMDVRLALAAKLVKLLPDLSHEHHSQLYAFAVQALGTLALDEVLKVRKALASTLKDHAHCPPSIAATLARDLEREVAEPILRFCISLADDELIDIVRQHPSSWAVEAAAGRRKLGQGVTEAIAERNERRATDIMLRNEGAEFDEATLEMIVHRAREFPEWHAPLAVHKQLPEKAALYLAAYVDKSIQKLLLSRQDFDEFATQEISYVVRRRVAFEKEFKGDQSPDKRAQHLFDEGLLDEDMISDALAIREEGFVRAALALMAQIPLTDIEKIMKMQAPKPVCAVCWQAGLSPRMALRIQQEVAGVPHKELLYPKGGTDYPISDEELAWQLDFLGILKRKK